MSAILSALSILDHKIKNTFESLEQNLSAQEHSANEHSINLNALNSGVKDVLTEVSDTSARFVNFENNFNEVIEQLKNNVNELKPQTIEEESENAQLNESVEKIISGIELIESKVNVNSVKFIELQGGVNASVEQLKNLLSRMIARGDYQEIKDET
ncbi:MAG: hypothetical protein MZU97_01870 [Bacillus subtilis]|nr:hypothetical protein [Bacillus subtilis]